MVGAPFSFGLWIRNPASTGYDRNDMHRRDLLTGLASGLLVHGCSASPEATASTPTVAPSKSSASRPQSERARPAGPTGTVRVGGSRLDVVVKGRNPSLPYAAYYTWVERSAQMIADYYGGTLPVPGVEITLETSGGGSVGYGHHRVGRWVTVYCGRRTSEADLDNDWVLVHELLHAVFPDLSDTHRWMQEGLSTYLEKIVRVRGGNMTETTMWSKFARSMHHGRPKAGDRGLDRTHTWGRTYWGGALFWWVLDVELRKAGNPDAGLHDALLHIASIGGNARSMWTTQRVTKEINRAMSNRVASDVYARMALAPGDIDTEALFRKLGVDTSGSPVSLRDDAPLANIRKAIITA